jgi:hypothetical protein
VHVQQRRCAGVVGVAAIHQPRHPFAVGPPRLEGASRRDKGETRTVQHRLPDRNASSPRIGRVLIARGRDAIEDRLTRADARREERSRLDASEAVLDALAKPEKRQDHENDDDQADDIDDAVHAVTSLCRLSEPVALKRPQAAIGESRGQLYLSQSGHSVRGHTQAPSPPAAGEWAMANPCSTDAANYPCTL